MQTRELSWEAELRGIDPTRASDVDRRHAAGPARDTNDVAKVVAFLASDDAEFITGEAISVNGGAFMD